MRAKILWSVLLLACLGAAHAQPAAAPAASSSATATLTPEQQAALSKQNQDMSNAAITVAQMIDQGKAGQLWDGASAVAKNANTRDDFIKQTTAARAQLGSLVSRTVRGISRTVSDGSKSFPAGFYISVSLDAQFSQSNQPVHELVSFHLDPDKVWRVTGYTATTN